MLSADVAEIILFIRSPEEGALSSVITPSREGLMESTTLNQTSLDALDMLSAQGAAALLPRDRSSHPLDDYLAERGLKDGMLTTLRTAQTALSAWSS